MSLLSISSATPMPNVHRSDTCLAYQSGDYERIVCACPWTMPSACTSNACAGVSRHSRDAIGRRSHDGDGERISTL